MFIYESHSKQAPLENVNTNTSANTENDFFFLKPGATRPAQIVALRWQGKAAALTALSGIAIRLKQWTSTASTSSTQTSTTPQPKNKLAPAAVATAGMASVASGTVTSGTGGPNIVGGAGCGASGPGGWVAINPDDVPQLDGGATMSMDLFSSSASTSALAFEFAVDNSEM